MAAPGACEPWTFKNIRGDLYRISPGVPRHLTHESHGWGKVTRAGEPVSCAAAGTVRAPAWVCAHPNFMAGCRVLGAWHHLCVLGVLTLWTSHRSPRSTPRCHPRGVTSALLSSVCIPHTIRPNGSRRCSSVPTSRIPPWFLLLLSQEL